MKNVIIASIVSLVIGIFLTVSGYFCYVVVKLQAQVASDTTTINQIVTFLNSKTAPAEATK